MKKHILKKNALVISTLAVLVLLFQNCQKGFINSPSETQLSSQRDVIDTPVEKKECFFNGDSYQPGQTLIGYPFYSVVAPAQCGERVVRTCLPTGEFDGPTNIYESCTVLSSQANAVDSLAPGQWLEVPNTHVRDVFTKNNQGGSPSGIVGAWGGGAYDTKRDRLIIWGGGHGDYAGNEIYVFDLNTLKWTQLNEPSPVPAGVPIFSSGYYPDGGPVSRHTYNSLQYLPDPVDRFCSFGGGGLWQTGQYNSAHTDCFNFDLNKWETQKYPDAPSYGIGAVSAYDPVTSSAWTHAGNGDRGLTQLDLKTGQWTKFWTSFSGAGENLGYYRTADIDPIHRKMVAVGQNKVLVWDLTKTGTSYSSELQTTGPQNVVADANPGFVYVPELKAFVGWAGGVNLYKLDLLTQTWTALAPASGSPSTPPEVQKHWGTFGRLRYSPKKKALVLLNSHDENVYVYKIK